MKTDSNLLMEAEAFVTKLLSENTPPYLGYHNLNHTREVVENARQIARHENFNPDETRLLILAAWFHDTGYVTTYTGHEQESIVIATGFLKKKKADEATILAVANAIKATIYTQKPVSKVEKALRDADFMHLGKENYFEYAELIRKEWMDAGVKFVKKGEFEAESIDFFRNHEFYTDYCRRELTQIKAKNLELLIASVNKRLSKQKESKKASGRKNTYSRGADSMLRLTARTQINLSSIADNKSNILISLNGIIISLGLAAVVSRFKQEPAIILPTLIFLIFSLSTIILAILSTRPNITTGKFTRADIEKKKVNLLFFGNFFNMPLVDYEWAVREMINDDKYLYAAMIKDQYYLGKVLARKYKLLRWAYNIFMLGIVVSVIAFLLVFLPV
ncbi:hypothetical protein DSECCO2_541440 [anaerobic digester metagenome]|nr:DUF5706 domain-containing protein [Lentimicrobiaceae bacterium]